MSFSVTMLAWEYKESFTLAMIRVLDEPFTPHEDYLSGWIG